MFRINAEIFSYYLFRFIFSIANPFFDKRFSSNTIFYKNGKTPIEDVSWEFQVIRDMANLFLFHFEAKNKGDHPGIYFEGAFIWWNATLEIYDINHYDDEEEFMPRLIIEENTIHCIENNTPLKFEGFDGNLTIFPPLFLRNCIVKFVTLPIEG